MGVIRGALWGLIIGGAGLSVASIVAPQPAGNAPPATPPLVDAPQAADVADPVSTVPEPPLAGDQTTVTTAPQVTAPSVQTPALEADTTPLPLPETAAVGDVLLTPDPVDAPALDAEPETPVLPSPQGLAPQIPANEGDLTIETEPPLPVLVEEPKATPATDDQVIVQEIPVETPDVVTAENVSPTTAAETPDAAAPEPAAIVAETEAAAPAATETAEAAPSEAETVTDAPTDDVIVATQEADTPSIAAPEQPQTAVVAPETVEGVAPEAASGAETAEIADVPSATAEDVQTPAADALTGTEVTDVTDPAPAAEEPPVVVSLIDEDRTALPQGVGGVKVNRVIGSAAQQPDPEPAAPVDDAPAATGVPLVDFAGSFDNPDQKPVLSLVLLDDGAVEAAPALIAQLPFSVTVLIDATKADAAEKTASYRAKGVEVGAVLQMPPGATPADVEIAMEAVRADLGEAVVVTDLGSSERAARDQMIAALAGDGRGFISLSKGLSNGLRTAETAGVPAVTVFRDLDADGQDARVIRRFLDQAAFRARQDEGVVLLGRVRPDTLSALTLWGTANRSGQVVIGPVSALMAPDVQ